MNRPERIFGLHAVGRFLERSPERVLALELQQGRHDLRIARIVDDAREIGISITLLPRRTLDRMAGGAPHQGVIATVRALPGMVWADLERLLEGLAEPPLLLALDGVQDPRNLGACLRCADAAGAHAVIAPRNRAVGLTPAARKVAVGAAETVPFIPVTNLARALDALAALGMQRIGAAGEGAGSLFETDLRGPLCLVLGAEDRGLRRLTRERCDRLVRLPMAGVVESLNVSVAAGIALYEAVRQRGLESGP